MLPSSRVACQSGGLISFLYSRCVVDPSLGAPCFFLFSERTAVSIRSCYSRTLDCQSSRHGPTSTLPSSCPFIRVTFFVASSWLLVDPSSHCHPFPSTLTTTSPSSHLISSPPPTSVERWALFSYPSSRSLPHKFKVISPSLAFVVRTFHLLSTRRQSFRCQPLLVPSHVPPFPSALLRCYRFHLYLPRSACFLLNSASLLPRWAPSLLPAPSPGLRCLLPPLWSTSLPRAKLPPPPSHRSPIRPASSTHNSMSSTSISMSNLARCFRSSSLLAMV